MKYYVCEGIKNGKYNATNKAREDVEKILDRNGFEKLFIETKSTNTRIKKIVNYMNNSRIIIKSLSKLDKNDIVFIQYPLINSSFALGKIINKFSSKLHFILLVHDSKNLRTNSKKIIHLLKNKDEYIIFNSKCDLILHNTKMLNYFSEKLDNKKIYSLNIFDYLYESDKFYDSKKNSVIIAGNLSPHKSKYISNLNKINVSFDLYGLGYIDNFKNVSYHGAMLPEELLMKMEGTFGLVWDGDSIEKCSGDFGEYLKYNNPHKTSLYLSAGIPVIVWDQSAISDFIIKNKVGIVVNSLNNLGDAISKLSVDDIQDFKNNARKIGLKLRKGEYLQKVLDDIINSKKV